MHDAKDLVINAAMTHESDVNVHSSTYFLAEIRSISQGRTWSQEVIVLHYIRKICLWHL